MRGNKTAAALSLVLSKHMFCWGQLSQAAAPPPGSPLIVSQRRRSQDSGGTGWLCEHCPETLYLHWYSAAKTQAQIMWEHPEDFWALIDLPPWENKTSKNLFIEREILMSMWRSDRNSLRQFEWGKKEERGTATNCSDTRLFVWFFKLVPGRTGYHNKFAARDHSLTTHDAQIRDKNTFGWLWRECHNTAHKWLWMRGAGNDQTVIMTQLLHCQTQKRCGNSFCAFVVCLLALE